MVFLSDQSSFAAMSPADDTAGSSGPQFQLVEYFAKACPHCVNLQPVWAAAKSEGLEGVKFVQKECYGDDWGPGKDLETCKAHGIEAFPTMVLYKNPDLSDQGIPVPPLMGATIKSRVNELLEYVKSKTLEKISESGGFSQEVIFACSTRNNDFKNFL